MSARASAKSIWDFRRGIATARVLTQLGFDHGVSVDNMLRHTGITWRAQRGDEPLRIQRAAGHDDLRTTQRYINEAQTFEGPRFGEPFPAVPLSAPPTFGSTIGFLAVENAGRTCFSGQEQRPQGDSNPR